MRNIGRKYQGGWAWLPAAITAVGSIAGGLIGRSGQKDTNSQNLQIAREQMDFQERMSNTAYQRAVKDMTGAGLSPMLAYSQGGASTPPGASATMENPDRFLGEGIARGAASAMQVAGIENTQAATETQKATARRTNAEAAAIEAGLPYSAANAAQTSIRIREEADKAFTEARTAIEHLGMARFEKEKLQPLREEAMKIANDLAKSELPERKAAADMWSKVNDKDAGEVMKFLAFVRALIK